MSVTTTPAIQYRAIARTAACAANQPRTRYNLPQHAPIQFDAYAFDQDFEMMLTLFPPASKNTPANAALSGVPLFAGLLDGNAILTRYSQPKPTLGGNGKFTASFARVPASWDDFVSQQITFPGFDDYPFITYNRSRGRQPRSRLVTVRQRHDYFVVDPGSTLTGAGVLDSGGNDITTVTSEGAIPILPKIEWLGSYDSGGGVYDALPGVVVTSLVPSGGFSYGGVFHIPTVPSLDNYLAMTAVAAAFTGTWAGTTPPIFVGNSADVASGQFCIEASKLTPYEGNIIDRVTSYALFQ